MERLKIDTMFDLAALMDVQAFEGDNVTFVGLYEDVRELIKELALIEEVVFERIDIEPVELDGYDKEYYINIDSDMRVWVEKAYSFEHDIYLATETDVLYITDDCNSKILERIDYEHAVEVTYEDDELECEEKDHVEETRVAVDDNGTVLGFEKTWTSRENGMTYKTTYTHYSNNQDMLKQLMENFNIKY